MSVCVSASTLAIFIDRFSNLGMTWMPLSSQNASSEGGPEASIINATLKGISMFQ